MRLKHLLKLKDNENQPPWAYIATYWLAKDNYNFGPNKSKQQFKKTPFCYLDLIYYIKIRNSIFPKLKNDTKTIYNNILQNTSKDHIFFGETNWKEKINNLEFTKIRKNRYYSTSHVRSTI